MKPAKILLGILAVLILGLILFSASAGFMVDLWWFESLGFDQVFWTNWTAQFGTWLSSLLIALVFLGLNAAIALKGAGKEVARIVERGDGEIRGHEAGNGGIPIARLLETMAGHGRKVSWLVVGVLSFLFSASCAGAWQRILMALHAQGFGVADPILGADVGFYVFTLPLLEWLKGRMLTLLFFALLIAVVIYLVRGMLRLGPGWSVGPRVRWHLALLVALFGTVLSWGHWLDRFNVLFHSRSSSFYGAGYADVTASLPACNLAGLVAFLAGLACALGILRGKVKLARNSILLYLLVIILARAVVPGLVQSFVVDPTEQEKERPYILHNIHFTRLALGLDAVEERTMSPQQGLSGADLAEEKTALRNVTLWDYRPLASTLDQLQVIRLYYHFPDVDIDRYRMPDGELRQVILGARELDQSKLPATANTWVNRNLVYTHGYGVAMSPVNVVTQEGLPEFFLKDLPPVSTVGMKIDRPEIYFGERTDSPVIVGGGIEEFDYPLGDQNRMCKYQADSGISLGSFFRRLAFALHFGDINYLISGYLQPDSRVLYRRNIKERLESLAPFLHFDKDPYAVVADGRLFWVADAFTVTSRFPYSRPVGEEEYNYIRNSVKAVVDAYTGRTTFFVVQDDPILRAWKGIYPSLFRDIREMAPSLRAHLRYPQDLFDIQASALETYHMEDPQVFYNKEDLWNIANEKIGDSAQRMESYYALLRLPGEKKPEFVLMIPYTPNKRDNMIAWLCARADGNNYGKMLLYKFPKQGLTYGPMQVSARVDQDPYISQQLTLWNQQGSSVSRGNLLVIPVKQGLLYIQPIYLQATTGKLPELKRVIVAYGNRLAMESTLDGALRTVFGDAAPTTGQGVPEGEVTGTEAGKPKVQASKASEPSGKTGNLARSALDRYNRAQENLKRGDFTGYAMEIQALRKDLEALAASSGK